VSLTLNHLAVGISKVSYPQSLSSGLTKFPKVYVYPSKRVFPYISDGSKSKIPDEPYLAR